MGLAEPYYNETVKHGPGTVGSDSTAGMFMKVDGDNEFTPSTSGTIKAEGILYKDRLEDARCTILMGGIIKLETVLGGAVVGDEIQPDASLSFPTKLAGGLAHGKILKMDGVYYVVKLYF